MNQQAIDKMQSRQSYRNVWHTTLMNTIQADAPYCCLSLWCAPCVSYMLRKRALYNDMARYMCCAGYMPYSGKCGESKCPELCLATEVLCCFGNSVASTRFFFKTNSTYRRQSVINGFMIFLQQLACIFSIIACIVSGDELSEASQLLNLLAYVALCSVCACMQTQHKIEMDKRDGKFGPQFMMAPPVQQMSRIDQPIPPPIGGYGAPPYPYAYPPPPSSAQADPYGAPPYPYAYPPPPSSAQADPYSYPPYTAPGYPPQLYAPAAYPPPGYPSQPK